MLKHFLVLLVRFRPLIRFMIIVTMLFRLLLASNMFYTPHKMPVITVVQKKILLNSLALTDLALIINVTTKGFTFITSLQTEQ